MEMRFGSFLKSLLNSLDSAFFLHVLLALHAFHAHVQRNDCPELVPQT